MHKAAKRREGERNSELLLGTYIDPSARTFKTQQVERQEQFKLQVGTRHTDNHIMTITIRADLYYTKNGG